MVNYPNIIYHVAPKSETFEKLLRDLQIVYKSEGGSIDDIAPGGTYILFYGDDADCMKKVSQKLGLELSYSFSESGLPKGAVPLLSGGKAYGGILENSGGSVILLESGSEEIIASSGETGRVLLHLSARKEMYERAYMAEQRLKEAEKAPSLQKEPVAVAAEPTEKEKISAEKGETDALNSFLFYGKAEKPEVEKEAESPLDFSWSYEDLKTDEENTLEEFIKEKPRKVMDASLLERLRDDTPETPKQKSRVGLILKIISIILVIGILAGTGYWYFTKDPKECDKVYSRLADLVTNSDQTDEDGNLLKYANLREINPDFAGYLTLPDAPYGVPVVTMEDGEKDYLKSHLFDGTANSYGSVYTKSNLYEEELPAVILLQGNDKDDNRLLGGVSLYLDKNYAQDNPTLFFDTVNLQGEWAVFSAFSFKSGKEPFLLDRESFLNDTLFKEYINNFYDNSEISVNVDASPEDTLLILVAEGKTETKVMASRLLREGETAENLQERKVVETVKPQKKPNNTEDVDETESSELEVGSSKTSVTSAVSSKNTSSKKPNVPTMPTGMRYEQTGLTSDMDKTAKVEMSNVVTLVDVTGLQKSNAVDILENTLGLEVKIEQIESAEKRGTVLKQSVAEGAKLSADVPISITISGGLADGKALVPDLIGNSESNAKILLEKAELTLGEVTTAESSLEAGTILSQSPKAEESVAYDTPINITVSDGKGEIKTVTMPNLQGKTKEEAKTLLKEAGLRVGKISTVTSSKTAGTVVEQECPKGEKIEEGSTVGFKISNGSKVNNLTVTNISSWSVTINGKSYAPGDIIKGDYMDIIPYIVEAEMGGGFNTEALKAQAVAAYCWLINSGSEKGAAPGVPMKNPTEKAISASEAVKGIKVMYGGETAQTYYYAIAADYSANCKDVWWADISYLRAVPSEGDKYASGYKTTVSYSADELKERVLETYGIDLSGINKSDWFSIKYDENKAYVREVKIGGKKTVTGSSMRDTLLEYELRSTAFKLKYNKSSDKFVFTVRGYGHGVGMSQVGANYYAGKGWSYERILTHYYPGTTLK